MKPYKFFYFPYAGASSITYNAWKEYFQPELELILIDYAGHGGRRNEPLYSSVAEACEDIYGIVKERVKENEIYYLGGHCIGAIIAYELYLKIRKKGETVTPDGLFLSGQGAPDRIQDDGLADMDSRQLLRHLNHTGVIESELLDEKIFNYVKEMVIEPVKRDSKICNEYKCDCSEAKLDCHVCVQYGLDEQLYSPEMMKRWGVFAAAPVKFYVYDADHYYMDTLYERYISDIKAEILNYTAGESQHEQCP